MRWWPRSIRWQMLVGLALLQALSFGLFAILLVRLQRQDIHRRAEQRLSHQADSIVEQAQEALRQKRPEWLGLSIHLMRQAPSVSNVRVTDPSGNMLFQEADEGSAPPLDAEERAQFSAPPGPGQAHVFTADKLRWESVEPIYDNSRLYGYVWIESDRNWDTEELSGVLRGIALFGLIWLGASGVLVLLMARSIARPLALLHHGTRELASLPESSPAFPLPVTVQNEFGELIAAFNRMVAAIAEQRAGLHDTLSLLDSMLANAPIGFAFFDRHSRFVRINQVFADLTGIPLSRQLGRTPSEVLPADVATQFNAALLRVFAGEQPVSDLEFHGASSASPWTWLVSAYPVRTTPNQVRWAGVIIRDVSERVRSEEALRQTEKLAATGRLAASIAHEINNPLEALTNLLYLLRMFCGLTSPAIDYVRMAEHEGRRIAEIAQKTLRFYRQSTLPVRANVADLVESILDLYKARMHSLNIQVERAVDTELTLFCYEGEIRQVMANLVGNAVDAIAEGGRLIVRARRSQSWTDGAAPGVRITVADTGAGMTPAVRSRIWEAFFTTKEDIGTGLGLWVSHEIIRKHNGLAHVRSRAEQPGQPSGTVFQLFVPDDETLAEHRRPKSREQATTGIRDQGPEPLTVNNEQL